MARAKPGCVPVSVPASPDQPAGRAGVSRRESVLPRTGRACAPRGPAGRLSLCGQSETCPGESVRAGQSRGPGSDRPDSFARVLPPASSSDAERGLRRSPPIRVRWYNRDCGVYPLGARATTRPRGQRAGGRTPWFHPSPTRPARGHPDPGPRVCHPRASHAVPDSDRSYEWSESYLVTVVTPSAPVQRPGYGPPRLRPGCRQPNHHDANRGPETFL